MDGRYQKADISITDNSAKWHSFKLCKRPLMAGLRIISNRFSAAASVFFVLSQTTVKPSFPRPPSDIFSLCFFVSFFFNFPLYQPPQQWSSSRWHFVQPLVFAASHSSSAWFASNERRFRWGSPEVSRTEAVRLMRIATSLFAQGVKGEKREEWRKERERKGRGERRQPPHNQRSWRWIQAMPKCAHVWQRDRRVRQKISLCKSNVPQWFYLKWKCAAFQDEYHLGK